MALAATLVAPDFAVAVAACARMIAALTRSAALHAGDLLDAFDPTLAVAVFAVLAHRLGTSGGATARLSSSKTFSR